MNTQAPMLLMLIEPKSDQTKTLLLEPMKGRKRRLYNKWHFKGLCEGGSHKILRRRVLAVTLDMTLGVVPVQTSL